MAAIKSLLHLFTFLTQRTNNPHVILIAVKKCLYEVTLHTHQLGHLGLQVALPLRVSLRVEK